MLLSSISGMHIGRPAGALRFAAVLLCLPLMQAQVAHAQNAAVGRTLYNTPFVSGQMSCSNSTCHTGDPTRNQNRIRNGTDPSNIQAAISSVPQMRFLQGAVTTQNMNDLAAYIANPNVPAGAPAVQVSVATAFAFPDTPVGSSSPAKTVMVTNTGNADLSIRSITSQTADFVITANTCLPSITIPPGGNCLISVHFFPTTEGPRVGALDMIHNATPDTTQLLPLGLGTPAIRVMVEYLYTPINFYFITSRDAEKVLLDTTPGFQRTGQSFRVYAKQQPGSSSILRYYFDKVAKGGTRGNHFYTLILDEKNRMLQTNPTNAQIPQTPYDEGIDSYAMLPVVEGVGGSCAAGLLPVYRLFRGGARFPDDPNYRFTTDLALYNDFVGQGWDGEGVKMCVPAQ
jgi:Abnormal spindle-like microcephaly-assoc'd, ASPM-SPD-2-Hydin